MTNSRAFDVPLSPELELVLCCSTPAFEDAARTRAQELLDRALNWNKFAALAFAHGLSPLVYTRLCSAPAFARHASSLQLKSDARALTQRALVLTTEMKRLIPRLEAEGIETLVLKGPLLARIVYGDSVLRAFTDLDIMVRPEDVARAWALLADEGYTPEYKIAPAHFAALIAYGNHLPFYGTPNKELVELHWTFFARSRAASFDVQGAWARREPICFDDTTVMSLAPRDLIHFLCLHGTKHAWSRLSWITDLAWFVFRYPDLDWDALLDHATRLGTRRMTLVGFALAQELFGLVPSEQIAQQLCADHAVLTLARWMWQRLLSGEQNLPTGLDLVRLVVRSRERPRDRARDLYHHVIALRPNNVEDAPASAAFLHTYTLHRLWFLVRKYGRVRV